MKDNFKFEVMNSDKPVLFDFWASWCDPCHMVSPILDEIAGEINHSKVGKINVDEQPELTSAYKVITIPMLAVFKNGKVTINAIVVNQKPIS